MNLEAIDGKPNPSRRDFLVQAAKIAGLAMAGIPAMATAANRFISPVAKRASIVEAHVRKVLSTPELD